MKRIQNLVSVFLLLCMVFALSVPAFAEGAKEYKVYTCLGDSIAAGCILNKVNPGVDYEFNVELAVTDHEKYLQYVEDFFATTFPEVYRGFTPEAAEYAYHSIVAKALGAELNQCARSGMRAIDLRYILTGEFTDPDPELTWNNEYFDVDGDGVFTLGDLDIVGEQYHIIKSIQEADLITLNLGSNDVVSPTFLTLTDMLAEDTSDPLLSEASRVMKETGSLGAALSVLIDTCQTTQKALDIFKTFNSAFQERLELFKENYAAILDKIYSLNPDVTIVGVGIYNFFNNFSFSSESSVDVSFLADPLLNDINSFISSFAETYGEQYLYADVPDTETYSMSYDDPCLMDFIVAKVHPDHAGHQYMAERILETLSVQPAQSTGNTGYLNSFISWFRSLFKWTDIMSFIRSLLPDEVVSFINMI